MAGTTKPTFAELLADKLESRCTRPEADGKEPRRSPEQVDAVGPSRTVERRAVESSRLAASKVNIEGSECATERRGDKGSG